MPLQDDYLDALQRLAAACTTYTKETGSEAVLVGGAAVTFFTEGLFSSGDFDVVAGQDDAFNRAMIAHGFHREDRRGHLLVGWFHEEHPRFGFQQVSGSLFDGQADRRRLIRVRLGSLDQITLPSVEDMVADRLAQHAIATPTDDSRLRQAIALIRLADGLDWDYLRQRTAAEGGDPLLLDKVGSEWNQARNR